MAALFGCSGRLDWARGWIFLAMNVAGMAIAAGAIKRFNPELMEARAKWRRKDTKSFDKAILSIYMPLTFLQPAVGGLDVRFGWSSMPYWTVYCGLVVFLAAAVLTAWALAVNRHAEPTVRIQTDRNHQVVCRGPCRIVRHPMYISMIAMYAAAGLVLGSVWVLAVAGAMAALIVVRTALEDRTLRHELPGYREYSMTTRYRLVPGVW